MSEAPDVNPPEEVQAPGKMGRPPGSPNKATLRRGMQLKEAAALLSKMVADRDLILLVYSMARLPGSQGAKDRRILWEAKFGKAPDFHNINLFGDLSGQQFIATFDDGSPALASPEALSERSGQGPST